MLERGASLPIVASIIGWSPNTTAKMAKRYGHIGSTVQRVVLDALAHDPRSGQADAMRTPEEVADAETES
jgi:succinyl-CoA synthetase alpha subunit